MKKFVAVIFVASAAVCAYFAARHGLGLITVALVVSSYTVGIARGVQLANKFRSDEQP